MKNVVLVLVAFAAISNLALAHDHEEFEAAMKATGANFSTLRKTVDAKQSAEASAAAEKLVPLFKKVQAHFEEHKMQDGISWSKTGMLAAQDLGAAAKAGEWDKATAQLKTLGGACQSCHAAHREKLSGGTYKMK